MKQNYSNNDDSDNDSLLDQTSISLQKLLPDLSLYFLLKSSFSKELCLISLASTPHSLYWKPLISDHSPYVMGFIVPHYHQGAHSSPWPDFIKYPIRLF